MGRAESVPTELMDGSFQARLTLFCIACALSEHFPVDLANRSRTTREGRAETNAVAIATRHTASTIERARSDSRARTFKQRRLAS
eukprot:31497-Pelagococcus_subviridis.AAC.59